MILHPSEFNLAPIRILLAEDDAVDRMAFARYVTHHELPYDYTLAQSLNDASCILDRQTFDLAILDYNLGDGYGSELFPILQTQGCPFIIATGSGDEAIAANLMKQGATEYLIKDRDRHYLKILPITVRKALERHRAGERLQMLAHAMQSVTDCIYIVDREGRLRFINDALGRLLGVNPEGVIGLPIDILGQPVLAHRMAIDPGRAYALRLENCAIDVEIALQDKNGLDIPMLLSESILEDGCQPVWVGVLRNISALKKIERSLREARQNLEQKVLDRTRQLEVAIATLQQKNQEQLQAQQALQTSESRYRALVEVIPDLMIRQDAKGNYLDLVLSEEVQFINPALACIGVNVCDLLPLELARQRMIYARQALETGEVQIYDFEIEVNGRQCWQETRIIAINEMEVLVIVRDITERKQAEIQLQLTGRRLQEAQRIAHLGNWELNVRQNTLYWSEEIFRIFEIDPQKFGASYEAFLNLVHPDDRSRVDAAYKNHLHNPRPYDLVHRLQMPDGRIKHVRERGETRYDDRGMPLLARGTVQDITGQKEAEIRRDRAETALRQVMEGTAAVTGEEFFPNLVRHLSAALQVRYAVVAELIGDRIHPLAFSAGGEMQPLVAYHPARTPCEPTLQQGEYHCDRLVRQFFPEDLDLVAMEAESYSGFALKNDRGETIGSICILDTEPMPPNKRDAARQVLQIFAARAGAELERKTLLAQLYQLNQELEERVAQRTRDLREREAQLRDLFDNATDLIQSMAPDGRILFVNRAWQETLGYDVADREAMAIFDILHPEDLNRYEESMQQLFTGTPRLDIEIRFLTQDGREIVVEGNVNAQIENGQAIATRGIFRDITQRKQAEKELDESKQFLQTVLDTVPLSVFWKDRFSNYLGANRQFLGDAGLSSLEDSIGKNDFDLPWGNTEAEAYRADDRAVMESGEAKLGIIETQHQQDGKIVWLETNKLPLRNLAGETIGVLGTYRDITERRNAELILQRQLAAIEAAIDGIGILQNERYQYINSSHVKMFGYERAEELLGRSWEVLYSREERERFRGEIFPTLQQQHSWQGETIGIRKDGTTFLQQVSLTRSADNLLICVCQNISDRKAAEAELLRANEDLARATRLKDEFLANTSHELRTPLNSILGMTEALQEEIHGTLNERQHCNLQTIFQSASHLLELIGDILDLAKIGSGRVQLECAPTSIPELCKASLAFVKQQAYRKNLQLESRVSPYLPAMMLDERRIRQVLINLLNNAVKFTSQGGSITLEVALETQTERDIRAIPCGEGQIPWMKFAVLDTGIGINPENADKLFQPFVQIDSALNRQYSGTGLGLSLVKRIVEMHGGKVGVSSREGYGSCFWFILPCSEGLMLSAKPEIASSSYIPLSKPLPTHQRILLAEDNLANIETMSSYLKAKGYEIIRARNGREAIEQAQSQHPDLILMDIQMPEIDGFEAIRRIRENPELAATPIIALTALAMESDRERCLAAGARDYLSKPVRLKELVTKIQTILSH
ncbi:MAG: PAS domain S-box protein [Cyanobacteria bacterium SBLK]|nr:PAS domain S-box protein [Cyanobacteria bacterium SBLK]